MIVIIVVVRCCCVLWVFLDLGVAPTNRRQIMVVVVVVVEGWAWDCCEGLCGWLYNPGRDGLPGQDTKDDFPKDEECHEDECCRSLVVVHEVAKCLWRI